MRKKQQEEREKLRRMQLDMQREVEERRKLQKEEEAKIRQEYIEKMKAATIIDDIDDKPTKKGGCTYLFQFASLILFLFFTWSSSAEPHFSNRFLRGQGIVFKKSL